MGNPINDLIYSIHAGLSVAEHQGDVRDYLPDLIELEALIARIKDEPELLEGFEADGLDVRYRAEGYVWCDCEEGRWVDPADSPCACGERDDDDEEGEP